MFEIFRGTLVKETIQVNALRAIAASIVWSILVLIMRPPGLPLYAVLAYPFGFPFLMLVIMPVALGVARMCKLGGVADMAAMLIAVPGDPLMCALHKYAPALVPTESYPPIQLTPYILVYKGKAPSRMEAPKEDAPQALGRCPFAGTYTATRDGELFGFSWPKDEIVMVIAPNWKIFNKDNKEVGWVDVDSNIHFEVIAFNVDPSATLLAKYSGYHVVDSWIYNGHEQVAKKRNF